MKKIFIIVLIFLMIGVLYFVFRVDTNNQEIIEDSFVVGEIYDISDDRVLIAEQRNEFGEFFGAAGWFRITEETEILNQKMEKIDFNELSLGLKVEAWSDGMILESYPVQTSAKRIVVKDEIIAIKECYIGGCSGEICSDDSMAISTCELLPGMECLVEEMSCELINSECSWVLSRDSALCLMAVEEEHGSEVRDSRVGYLFEKAEEFLNR